QHQSWALGALWFFVIYTLLRLFLFFTKKTKQFKWHLLLFLISFGGLYLLYETGEHGAKLVYKYHVNEKVVKPSSLKKEETDGNVRFDATDAFKKRNEN